MKLGYCLSAAAIFVPVYAQLSTPPTPPEQVDRFHPVSLSALGIPSFRFPESDGTLKRWVRTNNKDAIASHAWGLWAALMEWSSQTSDGERLRVFETWEDRNDLTPASGHGGDRSPLRFAPPRQLQAASIHNIVPGALKVVVADFVPAQFGVKDQLPLANGQSLKFNPEAARFIRDHRLFSIDVLKKMRETRSNIPPFTKDAMALKPVLKIVKQQNRYYPWKSWSGPPKLTQDGDQYRAGSDPDRNWPCVWIDVQDPDKDGTGAADCGARTDGATYGINQFIHLRLSPREAKVANAETEGIYGLQAGDYAVLVAMHVTTREMPNWTWQTFWWTDRPASPPAPSSTAVAAQRPLQFESGVLHYAQCTSYQEVSPHGESLYCYNPYIEALQGAVQSQPGLTLLGGKLVKTPNDVGVQTNCMSCHAYAKFTGDNTTQPLVGAGPVDRKGPAFKGSLRLDFLWSLCREAQ